MVFRSLTSISCLLPSFALLGLPLLACNGDDSSATTATTVTSGTTATSGTGTTATSGTGTTATSGTGTMGTTATGGSTTMVATTSSETTTSGPVTGTESSTDTDPTTGTSGTDSEGVEPVIVEGFEHPESAVYDGKGMAWYISNIVGDPGAKDGNGYISRLNSDGSVDAMQWATGFDGPKGLAIRGDRLYVADITRLHVVSLADGTILETHTIAGAGFLNDVAVDMMGSVYFSDTATNTIHVLKGGNAPMVFLQNDDLHGANGLAFAGDRLFVASIGDGNKDGAIYEIKGGAAVQLGTLSGPLDGLVARIDTLLVTDFDGLLYEVPYADGVPVLLRDVAADNSFMSSADLGIARDLGLLAIPDLLGDKVGIFPI